jgi:predicted AAA+ superfamily ATPase
MAAPAHRRAVVAEVLASLRKSRPLLHIVVGPRQVGKTTASLQIADDWPGPVIRSSAAEAFGVDLDRWIFFGGYPGG